MEYWNDVLTEKSWSILQSTKRKFGFILIGGWSVYLWSRALKSRDIDLVVDFENLGYLKSNYSLKKNDALKKYEIKIDEIDIDIYAPYYSKLPIPVEEIKKHTSVIEGFKVPKPEILLILKQSAEMNRRESEKGEKDRVDIMALLLRCSIDFALYREILRKNKMESYEKELVKTIKTFREIRYLGINPREFRLAKEKILHEIATASQKKLSEIAGILTEKEGKVLKRAIKKGRESSNKRMCKVRKALK